MNQTKVVALENKPPTLEGYVVKIDGKQAPMGAGPFELSLGCHVVVSSQGTGVVSGDMRASHAYGIRRVPSAKFFKFTAKAGHRYVIERDYQYSSNVPAGRVSSNANRYEIRTLAERDEAGALERRYFEAEASETLMGC
jgi:hypothetical protein